MKRKKMLYSVDELAKLIGVSRQAIFDRIRRGTLRAEKVGRAYVISKDEADRVRSEKR